MKFSYRFILVGLATVFSLNANAAFQSYSDRSLFESNLSNIHIDNFESPSYKFINTSAEMKALSSASIGYASTGFMPITGSHNLIAKLANKYVCWGCNGSGLLSFDSTTIGAGVFGVGFDVVANSTIATPYDAFITFNDNTTLNFDLGIQRIFFGFTSDKLIKSIHFGLPNGGTTTSGSFGLDNVTIGNIGNSSVVPIPAAAFMFAPALLGFLGLRRKAKSSVA